MATVKISNPLAGMSQSTFLFSIVLLLFVMWIVVKGELNTYVGFFGIGANALNGLLGGGGSSSNANSSGSGSSNTGSGSSNTGSGATPNPASGGGGLNSAFGGGSGGSGNPMQAVTGGGGNYQQNNTVPGILSGDIPGGTNY